MQRKLLKTKEIISSIQTSSIHSWNMGWSKVVSTFVAPSYMAPNSEVEEQSLAFSCHSSSMGTSHSKPSEDSFRYPYQMTFRPLVIPFDY
jgi:hypothetical protein